MAWGSRPVMGRRWVICGCALALWTGCDDGDSQPAPPVTIADAAPMDAGADAAALLDVGLTDAALPDADLPDAALDAQVGCGAACAELRWINGPPLPRVSDHHSTLAHRDDTGAALFVVGGIETTDRGSASQVYDTIERAGIEADGRLSAFETEAVRLPFPLGFQGQTRIGDRYYLTGGVTFDGESIRGSSNTVMLEFGPGPAIARAIDCGPMLYGVLHPTAEMLGDWLYVIGGSAGPPIDRVQRARIGEDGCPVDWEEGPRLPQTRSHHASAVIDGQIYLLGGFGDQNQVERGTILRSTLDAAGVPDGWEDVGTLDPVPWTASAIVADGTVWLVGGGEGNVLPRFLDTVQRAPILADGLGDFEPVPGNLPFARSHVHQTPLFEGHIYTAGGRIIGDAGLTSTAQTSIGRLVPPAE